MDDILNMVLDFKKYVIGGIVTLGLIYSKKLRDIFKIFSITILDYFLEKFQSFLNQKRRRAFALRRYLKSELANPSLNTLLIQGTFKEVTLTLEETYLPLIIEGSNYKQYTDANLLTLSSRILITGEPGSGKSTLVKKLFQKACKSHHFLKADSFPLRVELKTLVPDRDNPATWLLEALKKTLPRDIKELDECFDASIAEEGLLVLLDGLDEVSLEHYEGVRDGIIGLSQRLGSPKNTIVLTMRTQYYHQVGRDFSGQFPFHANLMPLNPSQVHEFLRRWPFKETEQRIKLYNTLLDTPSLKQMCTNPLVLGMYLAREHEGLGNPKIRSKFYKAVVEELLFRRRQQQRGEESEVLATKRREFLGRWAWEHLQNLNQPANTLSHKEGLALIQQCTDATDPKLYLEEVAAQVGLITPLAKNESWVFIHLSFCEFLAADYLSEFVEDGLEMLMNVQREIAAEPASRTRLLEVFPFLCGLLPHVRQQRVLDLLPELDRVALRCLYEANGYAHPNAQELLNKTQAQLLKNETLDLPTLSWFHITASKANKELNNPLIELEAFFKKLITRRGEDIDQLLATYASEDPAAVYQLMKICKINVFEQVRLLRANWHIESFREQLLGVIKNDPTHRKEWARILIVLCFETETLQWLRKANSIVCWGPGKNLLSQSLECVDNKSAMNFIPFNPPSSPRLMVRNFYLSRLAEIIYNAKIRRLRDAFFLLRCFRVAEYKTFSLLLLRYISVNPRVLFFISIFSVFLSIDHLNGDVNRYWSLFYAFVIVFGFVEITRDLCYLNFYVVIKDLSSQLELEQEMLVREQSKRGPARTPDQEPS